MNAPRTLPQTSVDYRAVSWLAAGRWPLAAGRWPLAALARGEGSRGMDMGRHVGLRGGNINHYVFLSPGVMTGWVER